ncbi:MAG TPA: hypothetical protein VLV81_09405 [Acidimicrobiia bacterium]|nr:hypothetical protein [Acidimicrobiia bacterium]
MLMMILELLVVSFVMGVCITAVVLASITGAETLLRMKRAHDGLQPAPLRSAAPAAARRVGQPRAA